MKALVDPKGQTQSDDTVTLLYSIIQHTCASGCGGAGQPGSAPDGGSKSASVRRLMSTAPSSGCRGQAGSAALGPEGLNLQDGSQVDGLGRAFL